MLLPYDALREQGELWDLYTRREEYVPQQLDQYGCFPYASGTYRNILEPAVSKFLAENGLESTWPEDKEFAVCLTHDVDEVYPPLTHTLLSCLTCMKKQDLSGLREQVIWKLHGKEKSPYRNFSEIMDLEEKYGACSSFYFLATGTDITRFRYNIEDLEEDLHRITDRGWEVGLHGGYYAFNDPEEILREKQRLEKVLGRKVIGNRNHYLRFRVPDSWEHLKKAGFRYDTSLGYNEMVGFRNGMCHPFLPYNLNTGREISILEIPLTIMDDTLFESAAAYEEAWGIAKKLIDTVAAYRGIICLNWHSESFCCPFKNQREKLYEKILDYCSGKKAWMTSGEKICEWWEKMRGPQQ